MEEERKDALEVEEEETKEVEEGAEEEGRRAVTFFSGSYCERRICLSYFAIFSRKG
jgi:hypothetical protein